MFEWLERLVPFATPNLGPCSVAELGSVRQKLLSRKRDCGPPRE